MPIQSTAKITVSYILLNKHTRHRSVLITHIVCLVRYRQRQLRLKDVLKDDSSNGRFTLRSPGRRVCDPYTITRVPGAISMVINLPYRGADHIHLHAGSILEGVSPLRPLYTSTAWCVRYWENFNPQYTKISQTQEQGGLKIYDVPAEFILNRYTPNLN
jgi:hypothetical protein